jgi:hypothetical protein
MQFPKLQRTKHATKKEQAQMLVYCALRIIDSAVFIVTLGFLEWEISRYYIMSLND